MTNLRICIDVDDLDRAIEFYSKVIGLRVGRRLARDWVELLGASSPIDLLANPAGSVPVRAASMTRDYRRHWTPVHLDYVVEDLDATVRRAEAAGAVLEGGIQEKKWGRLANVADPFGNGLCFLEFRGRGYDELINPSSGARS
jgi:predicted enzyme related to lactoylglutathione lyase